MRDSPAEVLAGGAVLGIAVAALVWALSATAGAGGGDYRLTASFRSVEGVEIGTDVRMAGVSIGRVAALRLDPATFRAETTLALIADLPIPEDSSAIIASEGLLGGTYIEIVPGGSEAALPDGGQILDTQGAVSLLNLLIKYVGGGGETP